MKKTTSLPKLWTDYFIYDKANDNVVQFSSGLIVIFDTIEEAQSVCLGNESVITYEELPNIWRCEILKQVERESLRRDAPIGDNEIVSAKRLLKAAGYYTDNLWCINDVQSLHKCTDEEAMEILGKAMTNESTMEQVWFSIKTFSEIN